MTSPDYIHLMKNAAAIVTDLGGILCHAAIIAREFNIPCIVGTLKATSILKDMDTVEVDADKGTITILKSR
jgi:pyruvate,water dikinase